MLEKQSKLSIGNANAKSPCQKQRYERHEWLSLHFTVKSIASLTSVLPFHDELLVDRV